MIYIWINQQNLSLAIFAKVRFTQQIGCLTKPKSDFKRTRRINSSDLFEFKVV